MIKLDETGEVEWYKVIPRMRNGRVSSVHQNDKGEYIISGYCDREQVVLDNDIILTNHGGLGSYDGWLIKTDEDGRTIDALCIGGTGNDYVSGAVEMSEGEYYVSGYFQSSYIKTEQTTLNKNGTYDGFLILVKEDEVPNTVIKQGNSIGGTINDEFTTMCSSSDGGYLVGGYYESNTITIGDYVFTKENNNRAGLLIKYTADGKIEWAQQIRGSRFSKIESVTETKDGGYIAVGYFAGETLTVGDITLINNGQTDYSDGMIIKYSSKGEVEWAESFGHTYEENATSVHTTKDGGYIVSGYFKSSNLTVGDYLLSNNGNYSDGILIKYTEYGQVEWAKSIGGLYEDNIMAVCESNDGSLIVVGFFGSPSITLGEYDLKNKNSALYDGMIIKMTPDGTVTWAEALQGTSNERITSVCETKDGGFYVAGNIGSNEAYLGEISINRSSTAYDSAFIAKYDLNCQVEWLDTIYGQSRANTYYYGVKETNDGGAIAVGNFNDNYLDIIRGERLYNKTGNYSWNNDGLVVRYDVWGNRKWAKGIGGTSGDYTGTCTQLNNGTFVVGGQFHSNTIEVNDKQVLTNNGGYDAFTISLAEEMGVPERQELEVKNERKQYNITTDIKKIDGIKGGSISGEEVKVYENVKHGDSNTKEIKMIPDENYEIIGITVNGKDWQYEEEADGSYTMPTFENMTENKHVVVTYSLRDNKITINKKDSVSGEVIEGAKFKLDQIEERTEPDNNEIIGELTPNGTTYTVSDYDKEVEGFIDLSTDLKHVEGVSYYFVPYTNEDESISYVPTNSKKWQTENVEGATTGVHGSTANSYVELDLSGMTGTYKVVVNGYVSSHLNDYGYATITTDENSITNVSSIPAYNNSISPNSRFIYLYGVSDNATTVRDRESTIVLNGGQKYYLHLGYRKDNSTDNGEDQFVINSIKLYETKGVQYNFEEKTIEEEGNTRTVYQSTNEGTYLKTANSYIPIDLEGYTGKYNITVNAEISTTDGDYGYVTINTTASPAPSYTSSATPNRRIIYITSTNTTEMTLEVDGGYKYYLHMGYYKDDYLNTSGEDYFRVNSINVSLSDSELYHTTVETNSFGQAITQIPFGKYKITELSSAKDYVFEENPIVKDNNGNVVGSDGIIEFRSTQGSNHEFTIENEKYAHVIVHHKVKGTEEKVAEDEELIGRQGEDYTTVPKADLSRYELEKDEITGQEILPSNKDGVYTHQDIEVTYYYVPRKINLTVHHYIQDTTMPVSLASGENASDVIVQGSEGDGYETSALSSDLISDEYELATIPENATGILEYPEVEVIYYYKKVNRSVEINKIDESNSSSLQHAVFKLFDSNNPNIVEIGNLTNNSSYEFTKEGNAYISGGKGIDNAISTSYIPIDMTNAIENITVKINAEISSESGGDFGYVAINESTTPPAYSDLRNLLFRISGSETKVIEEEITPGRLYYLHMGYRKDGSVNSGLDRFKINSIVFENVDEVITLETDENGKALTNLNAGTYTLKEVDAPEGYVLDQTPRTITITKDSTDQTLDIENERIHGRVIVHHYIIGDEGNETTIKVPLKGGGVAEDEIKEGYLGDIYATRPRADYTDRYELVSSTPENASGEFIDGDIVVTYYYRPRPTSVLVHHYLLDRNGEPTTNPVTLANGEEAEDVVIDGFVTDNYTTGMVIPLDKYESAGVPANANGVMTEEQIVVNYYYRLKNTSVTINYYIEGTTNKVPLIGGGVAETVVYNGKVDDRYETSPAMNVQTKYELVETPSNSSGIMTVEPITVNYYYRLKDTSVIVHYYLLDNSGNETTNKVLHSDGTEVGDITISGRVDDSYTTEEATDIMSKYRFVRSTNNTSGTMTEDQITVIYYYQAKGTSVLVHHYIMDLNGNLTENRVPKQDGTEVEDVTINGKVDDTYTTIETTDKASKYELVEEPANKSGTMTEEQIVVNYYYRTKETTVTTKHLLIDRQGNETTEQVPNKNGGVVEDVVTRGRIDSSYTTTDASSEILDKYELDTDRLPNNSSGTMTEEPITVTYYYRLKNTSVTVNYYIEGTTNKVPLIDGGVAETIVYNGKVDDRYETSPAVDVQTKYELVGEPTNKSGTMTVEPITVNYYYRLKDTSVIVHYYLLDNSGNETTNKVLHSDGTEVNDVTIPGRVDDTYTAEEATDVMSKYELVRTTDNTSGIMTEDPITVIYYYQAKDTQVIVHHLIEGTTNKVPNKNGGVVDDVMIPGKVDDNYTTVETTEKAVYYELVEEPTNKSGIMTLDEIEVFYYYKLKNYSYKVNYLEQGIGTVLEEQKQGEEKVWGTEIEAIEEKIPIDGYTYIEGDPETLTITENDNILNLYYAKRGDLKYTVNYIDKDTNEEIEGYPSKVITDATFDETIYASEEVIPIRGYNYDSCDKDSIKIATDETKNIINLYYTKRTDLKYTVNYIDKDDNLEIDGYPPKVVENKTYQEKIQASSEVEDIYGYSFDHAEPEELEIDVENNVINLYYTKKDARVIVHHYIVDTEESVPNKNGGVVADEEIGGKVYGRYETKPSEEINEKYVVIDRNPEGATGIFKEEDIEVTYYYIKKRAEGVVHHYQDLSETDGEIIALSADEPLSGRVDDPYTTKPAEDIPIKFEFNGVTPENAEGVLGLEPVEVTYYYRTKDSKVTFKYVDMDREEGEEGYYISQDAEQGGKVDETYRTDPKEIDGYRYMESDPEDGLEGILTVEEKVVILKYRKETKVTIKYIDINTDEEIDDRLWIDSDYDEDEEEKQDSKVVIPGLLGDEYDPVVKVFDGYKLVEEPEIVPEKMTRDEIVLIYKYVHLSEGILERHIDTYTKELLNPKTESEVLHTDGDEGDPYKIDPKTFEGYDLVEEKLPDNSEGKYGQELITVTYEYKKISDVIVKYIDIVTGEELTEINPETGEEEKLSYTIPGHEKDPYNSEPKQVDDYILEEVPENKEGEMERETIEVIYKYRHLSGGVIINYLNVLDDTPVHDQAKQEGYEGLSYTTEPENIPGYELVEERYPKNANGLFTIDTIVVNYYYKEKAKVKIIYVDQKTGEEITYIREEEPVETREEKDGYVGDDYDSEEKDIPGYVLIEEPDNKEGKMKEEEIEVVYVYARKAKVVARYMEDETGEPLDREEEQEGYDGKEYTTEPKDVKYYELIQKKYPSNSEGTMEAKVTVDEETGEEIIEDTTYVDYVYRKKTFNLKIDKKIKKISINGDVQEINSALGKAEINKKVINNADIKIIYTIKVTNDGELTGGADIVETIPTGMTWDQYNDKKWEQDGNNLMRNTGDMKPGDTKEYEIIFDLTPDQSNLGTKVNVVTLEKVENEAEFEELTLKDNSSKAEMVLMVGTGKEEKNPILETIAFVSLVFSAGVCIVYLVKKE